MKPLDRLIVFFLAAIFLYAGIDKLFHYDGFVKALRNYVLLRPGMAPYFATPVILLELFIGGALLTRSWRRPAALSAAGLLVIFTVALVINHLFGDNSVCGCWFTITLAQSSEAHIAQNLILAGLALLVWRETPETENVSGADRAKQEARQGHGSHL